MFRQTATILNHITPPTQQTHTETKPAHTDTAVYVSDVQSLCLAHSISHYHLHCHHYHYHSQSVAYCSTSQMSTHNAMNSHSEMTFSFCLTAFPDPQLPDVGTTKLYFLLSLLSHGVSVFLHMKWTASKQICKP